MLPLLVFPAFAAVIGPESSPISRFTFDGVRCCSELLPIHCLTFFAAQSCPRFIALHSALLRVDSALLLCLLRIVSCPLVAAFSLISFSAYGSFFYIYDESIFLHLKHVSYQHPYLPTLLHSPFPTLHAAPTPHPFISHHR